MPCEDSMVRALPSMPIPSGTWLCRRGEVRAVVVGRVGQVRERLRRVPGSPDHVEGREGLVCQHEAAVC